MERVGNPNVDTRAASQGSKSVKDPVKISQSNPFGALCDGDSGDDAVVKAAEQLKQASVSPKPDKSKRGKEKVNNTVASANNVNSRGGYSNGPRGHVNNVNSRGGYRHYQNGANGQRGGYDNHYQHQYGANGQRGPGQTGSFNGYNNRNQNPLYRTASLSRSSNGTDDGASDKAEMSSVKSERELREEFQKKVKDFKYDPVKEDENRKFLAKFPEILNNKSAEEREVLLNLKADALEEVRLADSKKMTLDEYEKMKEEQRNALRASNTERRVVESSDFDGLVVVSKKNLEDDSLSLTSVHKQKMEAEKTEKSQKAKKKKNTQLLVFGGSQSQGHFFSEQQDQPCGRGGYNRGGYQGQGRNFSEQQDQPRGRGGYQGRGRYSSEQQGQPRGRGAGSRPQVQSVKRNGGVPSLSLDSQDNFPGLRSAPGA